MISKLCLIYQIIQRIIQILNLFEIEVQIQNFQE